jgi:hypothetical protein
MLSTVLIAFVRELNTIEYSGYFLSSEAVVCSSYGSEYTLSFWANAQYVFCLAQLQVSAIGSSDVLTTGYFDISGNWTQYSFTFPVSAPAYDLYLILGGCQDNYIVVDDWSFAPELNAS